MKLYAEPMVTIDMVAQRMRLTRDMIKDTIKQYVSYETGQDYISQKFMDQQFGICLGSKREPYYTTEQEMLTKPTYTYEQVQHEA